MNKFFKHAMCICLSVAALGTVVSCTEASEDEGIKSYSLEVSLDFGDIDITDLYDFEATVTSSTGSVTALEFESYDGVATVEALTAGSYTVSVTGQLTETEYIIGQESVELYSDSSVEVSIATQTQSAIIFKTIHHASSGFYYISDCYFELVNNSDEVQYLDQLMVGAYTLSGTQSAENVWQAAGILDRYNASSCYTIAFPGNGTDYPLEPGESVLVANTATTHYAVKEQIENEDGSITVISTYDLPDLASASFEVFNDQQTGGDIDYEATNMDIIFSNTLGMKSFGFGINGGGYMIARCPEGVTPAEYGADPDNIMTTPNSTSETQYLMFNSENLLDAVFIVSQTNTEPYLYFQAIDDAGYVRAPTAYSGDVVMRKTETVDGVTKYVDTNNSTNDFNTDVANPYITVTATE